MWPPKPEAVQAELARRHLIEYIRFVYPEYDAAPHLASLAESLERVERGDCKRLMIWMPPRHGKSFQTSEFFPAWIMGRDPRKRIIHCTYAQDLADDFGRKVRNNIRDDRFQQVFDTRLADDSAAAARFSTSAGGSYYAVGIGGPITGRGADILLIDDPIKNRQDAESETIRRQQKDWYRSTAYTRLMPGGAIIIIQTRWHGDDLSGWLLRDHPEENWEVISFPAIAELGDALGRIPGSALWPDKYPIEVLQKIKMQLGGREWTALFQQSPTPAEGAIFKLPWFRRYSRYGEASIRLIHSWDTGIKPDQINDPSVCETWAETENGWYLLDVFLQRLEYPDLRRAVENLAAGKNPSVILIEDKGSGQSLIQDLQRTTRLPVIAVDPGARSKIFRAQGVSPLIEAGKVWLPEKADWLPDFESEIAGFPAAPHDDQVDAMSQALEYLRDSQRIDLPGRQVEPRRFSAC